MPLRWYSQLFTAVAKLMCATPLLSVAKLSQRIHSVASPCLCQTTLHHSNQYPASPSQIKPVDTTPLPIWTNLYDTAPSLLNAHRCAAVPLRYVKNLFITEPLQIWTELFISVALHRLPKISYSAAVPWLALPLQCNTTLGFAVAVHCESVPCCAIAQRYCAIAVLRIIKLC